MRLGATTPSLYVFALQSSLRTAAELSDEDRVGRRADSVCVMDCFSLTRHSAETALVTAMMLVFGACAQPADRVEASRPGPVSEARPPQIVSDTTVADLSSLRPDIARCLSEYDRDQPWRFEQVGEVESRGTQYILVAGVDDNDPLPVRVVDSALSLLKVESGECQSLYLEGVQSEEDLESQLDSVAMDKVNLQIANWSIRGMGGPRRYEELMSNGEDYLFDCDYSDREGCIEADFSKTLRSLGVRVR